MGYVVAKGSVSSSGFITTTSANQEFDFSDKYINYMLIRTRNDDITVKINDETDTHIVAAGDYLELKDLLTTKFTIVENGVEIYYMGTYLYNIATDPEEPAPDPDPDPDYAVIYDSVAYPPAGISIGVVYYVRYDITDGYYLEDANKNTVYLSIERLTSSFTILTPNTTWGEIIADLES